MQKIWCMLCVNNGQNTDPGYESNGSRSDKGVEDSELFSVNLY